VRVLSSADAATGQPTIGTGPMLAARADGTALAVLDRACGGCDACRRGVRVACTQPVSAGRAGPERWRQRPDGAWLAAHPELLLAAALADEALRAGPAAPVVVVLGAGDLASATAVAARGAGAVSVAVLGDAGRDAGDGVLWTHDDAELREWVAARSPSGRADVVLAADDDLARAARIVRRGGAIATTAPGLDGPRPTVTTLVQRELELPPLRDLVAAALRCALPEPTDPSSESHRGGTHGC